jgi:hypothetical protein
VHASCDQKVLCRPHSGSRLPLSRNQSVCTTKRTLPTLAVYHAHRVDKRKLLNYLLGLKEGYMKIQDKDFYYGVVLTQIAEHPTFTSINKVTEKNGVYQINDVKRILIKYSTADDREWRFTFRKDDFEEINDYECYFVLVCSSYTICLLSSEDIGIILDTNTDSPQWISVNYPEGGQMRVKGSLGELPHAVAHSAFPKNLFEGATTKGQENFLWPPFSKLNFYRNPPTLIFSSEDRKLDLADSLTGNVNFENKVTIYFGLTTISHIWEAWTEANLEKVEEQIKYDIEFDGFDVEIERATDAICPYTKKQDIPCRNEFLWKLTISVALYEDEEDIKSENTGESDLEIRNLTPEFPNLVSSEGESVCPVEIDVDHLSQVEKYQYGGWEDLIKTITARWVKENSFSGVGTIWAWGTPSVNFHHQSFSMFYAVLGMPKKFREYLGTEIGILGEHVRAYSDYVIPSARDGWDARCHIEDGKVWEMLDAATWKEAKA